jgi:WhiB family redox-sensing transcriptional regulator
VNFVLLQAVTPVQQLAIFYGTGKKGSSKSMEPLALQSNPFNGTQLCAGENPDVFFPEKYTNHKAVQRAKGICGDCWIKEECFKYAIQIPNLEGIWAGTTPQERKRLLKTSAI